MHSDLHLIVRRRVADLAQESSRVQLARDVARTPTSRPLKARLRPRADGPNGSECRSAADSWAPLERAEALEEPTARSWRWRQRTA